MQRTSGERANERFTYGIAKLPISTSALIIASQLAFTAAFAFLLVKQKFTSYSVNAIFLLSIGAGVLALHSSSDRPANESNKEYYLGFFMTLAAATLYGFILPLVELTYKKAKQAITYSLVMEIQMVMCFFATVFCTVGIVDASRPRDPRSCQVDARFQPRMNSSSVDPTKDVRTGCPDTPFDGFVSHGSMDQVVALFSELVGLLSSLREGSFI